jgi:hypothetical protein
MTRTRSWVVLNAGRDGRFECHRCGGTHVPSYPVEISLMVATTEWFGKMHKGCKEPDGGPRCRVCLALGHKPEECPEMRPATPEAWLDGPDTGRSSLTIYGVLHHEPSARARVRSELGAVPLDPADFGRCHRLLLLFPTWAARLHEVATRYPDWAPLVSAWRELASLYEEEYATGFAPRLMMRMQDLRPVQEA